MENNKKRGSALQLAILIFGVVNIILLAVLIFIVIKNPEELKEANMVSTLDVKENAGYDEEYSKIENTENVPVETTVTYEDKAVTEAVGARKEAKEKAEAKAAEEAKKAAEEKAAKEAKAAEEAKKAAEAKAAEEAKKKAEEQNTQPNTTADFVFPNSSTVLLTDSEIAGKITSLSLSRRAINEIYARYGYQFTKQENLDFFNQFSWYKNMAKVADMSAVYNGFSSVEKANVIKLQAFEDSKGWMGGGE